MISDQYRKILQQVHSAGVWGVAASTMIDSIEKFVRRAGVNHVLDYGAGSSGILQRELPLRVPGLTIDSYEPGIPELAAIPEPAPLVLCIDVLEHVEPEYVDAVLDDLQRVTIKYGFFTIATQPAQRILPDGRNAHLTVRPIKWWVEKIQARWPVFVQNGEHFWIGVEKSID